ncbi:MAG: hypothetical protein O7C67_16130, partial [Gammaproteobacteria bacterium]|nr:hypothetical protein [Gammaproteobacteria bacterium]
MKRVVAVCLVGFAMSCAAAPAERDELQERMDELATTFAFRSANDIGIMARFHFATHTKDFDEARAFYRMLGYTDG